MTNEQLIEQAEDELGDFDHWHDTRAIKPETYRQLLLRFRQILSENKVLKSGAFLDKPGVTPLSLQPGLYELPDGTKLAVG